MTWAQLLFLLFLANISGLQAQELLCNCLFGNFHHVNTFTQSRLSKAISPLNILGISCDSDSVITRPCTGICVDFIVVSKCTNITVEAQVKGCSDDLSDIDPEVPPMSYFVEDEEYLTTSVILTENSTTYVFEVEYCGDSFESTTENWKKEEIKSNSYELEYIIMLISIFIGFIHILELIIQDYARMNELELVHRRLNPTIQARGERA
ncbi:hypothetical protein GCK72_005288 [Caenorhabditis remanei]|uniref:Uncharacterized protein n=1 Tax=Caenorhabditis remanei TaxID=31234 RepID=A0A6A5HF16_CAERE|nr:hypothetical protein GCK72_005288 [Caenorhabditis remanei]KAF1765336.1 hypothetical protein GCK72_005288 [Caenorhabditis remanei]